MQVWKLYNTKTMDFHLFFCARKAIELQVCRTPTFPPCMTPQNGPTLECVAIAETPGPCMAQSRCLTQHCSVAVLLMI